MREIVLNNFKFSDENNTEQSFLVCKITNQCSTKKPKTREKNGAHDDDYCYCICHLQHFFKYCLGPFFQLSRCLLIRLLICGRLAFYLKPWIQVSTLSFMPYSTRNLSNCSLRCFAIVSEKKNKWKLLSEQVGDLH